MREVPVKEMTLERKNPNCTTKPAPASSLLERERYFDLAE
jgi:hypothetical protein